MLLDKVYQSAIDTENCQHDSYSVMQQNFKATRMLDKCFTLQEFKGYFSSNDEHRRVDHSLKWFEIHDFISCGPNTDWFFQLKTNEY